MEIIRKYLIELVAKLSGLLFCIKSASTYEKDISLLWILRNWELENEKKKANLSEIPDHRIKANPNVRE